DEPDTAFMRKHIGEMEKTPFAGAVFHVKGSFMNEGWSGHAFKEAELAEAVADLKATKFQKFTSNFLRFNVTPGDVDWFDDAGFKAIVNNARLAAKVAKARGDAVAGVLFDIEQYNTPLWTFNKQRDAAIKKYVDYHQQVHQRG